MILTLPQRCPTLILRLVAAIRDSPACQRGLLAGQHLLVIYDAKLDSELDGDASKTAGMRMHNFKRVIKVLCRARGGVAAAEVLPKGDVLVVSDGFHGLKTGNILNAISEQMWGQPEDEEADARGGGEPRKKMATAPPKTLKNLMVVHAEEDLASRCARSSSGIMAVRQVETLLCISWSSLADLRARPNILHPGSTNGQVLSGVSASNVSRNVKLWCRGDSLLDVKLLDLQEAYMVKVGDLEPWCPSVCAPEASQKWMILDPRTRVAAAPKKRKRGILEDCDADEKKDEANDDGRGNRTARSNLEPTDLVPLTFWSPGTGLYRELIHRFNAGCVIDLTAIDSVSALASVPNGLAWTAVAQTAAHAAHLRARVAAGLFHAMLDRTSPLFSPELACACRSIAAEIPGIMPQEKTDKENTPQKRPRVIPGYTNSHIAASATKKKKRSDKIRLRDAMQAKAGARVQCDLLVVHMPGQPQRLTCLEIWGPYHCMISCARCRCGMAWPGDCAAWAAAAGCKMQCPSPFIDSRSCQATCPCVAVLGRMADRMVRDARTPLLVRSPRRPGSAACRH